MCEPKNNLIKSGSIRHAQPRRIVPDNAGLAGRNPAASGSRLKAGCCRILPDAAAAAAVTITITMMTMSTMSTMSTSTSTSTNSGNNNTNV